MTPQTNPQARQGSALAIICLATAMLMLDIAVVNTALPSIQTSLVASASALQWVVDGYSLALAATVLTAGSLADRLGHRRVFIIAMALFTATSLLCGLSTSATVLDLARGAQGFGAAGLFASSLALLADVYPNPHERGKAFAAYGATIGASFAIGPLVGGAMTSGFGWRSVFFLNFPLGLAAIAATSRVMPGGAPDRSRRPDWPGQVTAAAALFLLVYGLLRGGDVGWSSANIVTALVASGILAVAFLAFERRSDHPMLPLVMFRNRTFAAAQVIAFGISATFFALFLYTTLYLQDIRHLSPVGAGLVYLPGTFGIFVVSAVSASMTQRQTPGRLAIVGLVVVAVGEVTGLLAGVTSSWILLLPCLVLGGIGTGLVNPAVIALNLAEVDPSESGLASGVNDTARSVGIALGVAVLGALVPTTTAFAGVHPQTYVHGMHEALVVAAAVTAISAAAAYLMIRSRRSSRTWPAANDQLLAAID